MTSSPRATSALADPARLHLLAATGLLDASTIARLPTLDRVARLAAHATRAPLAQVNLVTADAQVPAAAFVHDGAPGAFGSPLDSGDADLGGAWRVRVGLESSICRHVVEDGRPLVIADTVADARSRDVVATLEAGVRAYAAAPLTTPSGHVLGTVCVVDFAPREWSEDDVAALQECVALAGEEVAARLGASAAIDAERRAREAYLEQLQRFSAALGGATTLDEVATTVVRTARASLGAGACLLARVGEGAPAPLDVLAHDGAPDACDELGTRAPFADALRTGEPTLVDGAAGRRLVIPCTLGDGASRRAVGAIVLALGDAAVPAEDALLRSIGHQTAQALERARLYETERLARAEAEAASRAKGDFLATMSHELRTPLNAIQGHVQLLEMGLYGTVSEAQRATLDRVQGAGRHLLGLIDDVLNYARLDAGRVVYDLRPVDLRTLVQSAASLVEPQRLARGIALALDLPPSPVRAIADDERVSQVLVNLLANAVKFTPEGGRIRVRASRQGALAVVEVEDTGIGIPADRQESIFAPFVQVDASRARAHDGTGLGLTISRELARGMGGDLTVESTLGAGSTFRLALPVAA